MSELQAEFVYQGYWVNLAYGSVMGQTFTMDTRKGTVVISLLTLLSTLGLSHLWNLITYAWHQARADGQQRDGLFRQQQILLRTLPSPTALIADSCKIWFAWRKSAKRALLRTMTQATVAIVFKVASIAASIFSSYVAVGSNIEVLVNSPHCATLNWEIPSWQSYIGAVTAAVESYAPHCYRNGTLPSGCNIFSQANVAFSTEKVTCPFEEIMCASAAIALDSGPVDISAAFGLNLEEKDKVTYRKRSVCSMLPLAGRTEIINSSMMGTDRLWRKPIAGETFITFKYGTNVGASPDDFTFFQSTFESNTTKRILHHWTIQYTQLGLDPENFRVLPQLQVPNADITLRQNMLNQIRHENPVNDPMFAAHQRVFATDSTGGSNMTIYLSDFPATMTACTEQYQYFNVTSKEYPQANDVQLFQLSILRNAANIFNIAVPKRYVAQAENENSEGILKNMEDDQWIREIQGWYAISWAAHQTIISDYSIGPTVRDPLSSSFVLPPPNDAAKALCKTQKMRKPGGFVNISVFGLVFIVVVSSIVTIIDVSLLRFVALMKKFRKLESPRLDRWMQDGIFHLQRHAYEAFREGEWKHLTSEVPITVEPTQLSDLPLRYTGSISESYVDSKDAKIEHLESVTSATIVDDKTTEELATSLQQISSADRQPYTTVVSAVEKNANR
ncbi:hypothetical protein EJ04DRAFT_605111 [Polyplosphaeria fusca]|uniref:Uncharacterized protein n=1 Tax=Polyplosphaeria fusca TaxID=682080 RepID=A0A9P4QWH8_9PLEO|nr:hypothetical protein EJ04DRAFT_605111 [Polyplosphaeria fusca]